MERNSIRRLQRLYDGGITIPVINSTPGKAVMDVRNSLRQGGAGSMNWFAVGIDPLVVFLQRRLKGIPVVSLPVSGPVTETEESSLPPLVEHFKVMAFCDNIKPTITNLEEFNVADKGARLFERASGTKLHRDP